MPGRDGTGPMTQGALTGRGLGFCLETSSVRCGLGIGMGFGRGRGFGRRFAAEPVTAETQAQILQAQKDILENRLEIISKQLEDL